MKLIAELRVDDPKSNTVPMREERIVIRPSLSSTAISIGPFKVTLRGDSTLDVEFDDIENGFEISVVSSPIGTTGCKARVGSFYLEVTVEDDPIVDCEFAEVEDPTDGDDEVLAASSRVRKP